MAMVKQAAVIKNGKVVNVVVADEQTAQKNGWIISDEARRGDDYENGTFTRPVTPDPVPVQVDRGDMMIILEEEGLLTQVEAWMQSNATNRIKLAFKHKPYIHRKSNIVKQVTSALGWTEAYVDELFRKAGTLET